MENAIQKFIAILRLVTIKGIKTLTYIPNYAINNETMRGVNLPPFLTTNPYIGDMSVMAKIKSIRKSELSQENRETCIKNGCGTKQRFKGLCSKHYTEYLSKGYKGCSVDACKNKVRSAGSPYCDTHYYRVRRSGTINLQSVSKRHITDMGYIKIKASHTLSDKRGWVSEHRLVLFNKIGPGKHPCYWCGREVDFDLEYPKDLGALVIDHLDGNKENNNPDNLVPSCAVCNLKRGAPKMMKTVYEKRSKWIEFNGENKTLGEWADKVGITKSSLEYRLRSRWPLGLALTEGRGKTGPKRHEAEHKRWGK